MAEHVWSVLCDRSVIDKSSNQVSLLNVVESLNLFVDKEELDRLRGSGAEGGERPLVSHRMHFVTWWVRSDLDTPETVLIRLVLISPAGDLGTPTEATIDLSHSSSYRLQIAIDGLAFRGEGRYWFAIEEQGGPDEWREVARIPLGVAVREASDENLKAAGLKP